MVKSLASLAAVVLVLACGGPSATGARSTPTVSSGAITSPAATLGHLPAATSSRLNSLPVSCTGDAGASDPVAVVTLHGQTNPVLRDYADEWHPRTFCSFAEGMFPSAILDPHHVVVGYGPATYVLELPSGRAFGIGVSGVVMAVAPDLSQVLWYSDGDTAVLHDSWDQGDVAIQSYQNVGGICGMLPAPGAFSRDSKYGFAWSFAGKGATYLNVVGNHKGLFSLTPPPPGWPSQQEPSMVLWSAVDDRLYYNALGSVWSWTPSDGAKQLRPRTLWSWPSMAGDGRHMAAAQSSGNATSVHLIDPTSGADLGQIGGGQRFLSMFLSNDLIWMRTSSQGCGPSETLATYVYDLRDKSEYPSSLDWVTATWPGTSALGG